MRLSKHRARANAVDYSQLCGDCLRDKSVCMNRQGTDRFCGYCKKREPVWDFFCGSYWSRKCYAEYQRERRANEGVYYIDCSYCGKPISKAPFCDETCRKAFEKQVQDEIEVYNSRYEKSLS